MTGRLVPPRDPQEFSGGVLDLLGDEEAARRMGKAGLELAQSRFAFQKMVAKVQEVYEELVAGRGAAEENNRQRQGGEQQGGRDNPSVA